jgi:N-acetylglucosaminyldiphosphoundecaprenol N-acetyl-beta-D-mannosaminyltransferase
MTDFPTIPLLGLSYVDTSLPELSAHFAAHLTHGDVPLRVFTPNATIAAAALHDASLHALLCRADLLLPDGRGVLIASRLAKTPLQHRLPGIEVAEALLPLCAALRAPVYFLGAAPGIARHAAAAWKERLPDLMLAGTHHGYLTPDQSPRIVQEIRDSGARVLFVCLGFPQQERWICEHLSELKDVRIAMGLGGSFDVWAGKVRRAPLPVRKAGLEWLWRTAQRPTRIRTLLPALSYFRAAKKAKCADTPVKI